MTILPVVHPGQNTNKVRQSVVMTQHKNLVSSEGNSHANKCTLDTPWINEPTDHFVKELKRYVLKPTRMFQSTQSIIKLMQCHIVSVFTLVFILYRRQLVKVSDQNELDLRRVALNEDKEFVPNLLDHADLVHNDVVRVSQFLHNDLLCILAGFNADVKLVNGFSFDV